MDPTATRFEFGDNWREYVEEHFSEERLEIAKRALQEWYSSVEGHRFLDIGSGSGLYSRAAYELGATQVYSFDYDSASVEATEALRKDAGSPKNWTVEPGDVLDEEYVENLGEWERVMAWGVLHHTGDMWKAIDNACSLVAPGGELWMAIYSDSDSGRFSSEDWLKIKRFYSNRGWIGKRLLELWYMLYWMGIRASRGENPIRQIRQYQEIRNKGMAFYPDVKDWLGGLPYEFASAAAIQSRVTDGADFECVKSDLVSGTGNNEFRFDRIEDPS